jgi:amino acid transporter
VLGPPKYARFLEYLVGWLTISVYWFITTGNTLYLAETTVGWVEACQPGFTASQWQIYLTSVAWAVLLAAVNLPGLFKLLPHLMTAGVVLINCSWIFIAVSLLTRVSPKNSAKVVFVDVVNESGWSSDGVVFFLAILPGLLSVSGFDAVTHITDEVPNPKKEIPQVILGSTGLSAFTGLAMVIVYSFCTVHPDVLLEPYAHQPIINVFQDGLRSDALFHIAMTAFLVTMYIASVAAMTSWNRLYWSFSRANGLPFSRCTAKLSGSDHLPINALIVNFFMVIILGALGVGSLTALNAIFGSSAICALASFSLCLFLAIRRGRAFLDPERWLNLGRFGLSMQCVALVWAVFASVWLCFPLYLPVTPEYMNWTVVILAGIVVVATVYYLGFRRHITAQDFYA